MSNEICNEQHIQQRVLEVLPTRLQNRLSELVETLRREAVAHATNHLVAAGGMPRKSMGTFAEDCMYLDREAQGHRCKALEALGRIEGIKRASSQMFGAMGVKPEGRDISQYLQALHEFVKSHIERAEAEAVAPLLANLRVSPAHPDYASVHAAAVMASAERKGLNEVLLEASALAESLLERVRAESILA